MRKTRIGSPEPGGRSERSTVHRCGRLLLVAVFVSVAWLASAGPVSAADPLTCAGYPEQRVFLEAQGWWKDATVADPEGRHLHVATCFPSEQKIRGTVHFDIRIMLHNAAKHGTISAISVSVKDNGSNSSIQKSLKVTCATDDCTWWVPFDFDTTRLAYNGRWEWRFIAHFKTVLGTELLESTRWNAVLDNPGKPLKDGPYLRSPGGAGWYTGVGYANVLCPTGGYDFASRVLSGVVSLTCKFDRSTTFASVDPAFHASPMNAGKVLFDQATGGTKTITIDTRALPNGAHKLFLRTDASGSSGKLSGVLVLPFVVRN